MLSGQYHLDTQTQSLSIPETNCRVLRSCQRTDVIKTIDGIHWQPFDPIVVREATVKTSFPVLYRYLFVQYFHTHQ